MAVRRERASRTPSPGQSRARSLAIPARSSIGVAAASTSAQRAPGPPSPPRPAPRRSPRRLPARTRLANASRARSLAIRASSSIGLAAADHPASTSSASRLASRLALRWASRSAATTAAALSGTKATSRRRRGARATASPPRRVQWAHSATGPRDDRPRRCLSLARRGARGLLPLRPRRRTTPAPASRRRGTLGQEAASTWLAAAAAAGAERSSRPTRPP